MDLLVEHDIAVDPIRIGGAGLVVRDLAATLAFYRDAIGLDVIENEAGRALLGAGGAGFLELLHRPDAPPDDPREAGLFHIAFLMPSRADLADWMTHVAAHRVRLDGASDHAVSEAIYLSDPEGNGVEVYADRPRASWRWEGDQVVMTTLRLDLEALLAERTADGWRGAPALSRIGHVHLRVGDVARASAFWTGEVGLDLVRAMPSAAFLSSGGYHHHIAANVWRSAGAAARDALRAGLAYVRLDAAGPARAVTDPWGTEIRLGSAPS
jgi:catechol 2,3-dioxygenase